MYLAVVMDLLARKIALIAQTQIQFVQRYEWLTKAEGDQKCYVSFRPRLSLHESSIQTRVVEISNNTKYEPTRKLLGSCTNGAIFRNFKKEWMPKECYNTSAEAKRDTLKVSLRQHIDLKVLFKSRQIYRD